MFLTLYSLLRKTHEANRLSQYLLLFIGWMILLPAPTSLIAQSFQEVDISFPENTELHFPDMQWGDLDNDGRLDLIYGSYSRNEYNVYLLYQRENGFETVPLASVRIETNGFHQLLDLGDFDNDDDLDILLSEGRQPRRLLILENTDEGFREYDNQGLGFSQQPYWSVMWGDYDNDGDSDFLFSGLQQNNLYQNRRDVFVPARQSTVRDVAYGVWVDVDRDHDLDIIGFAERENSSYVWKNDEGDFIRDIISNETKITDVQVADYNGDGKLDHLLKSQDHYAIYQWGNDSLLREDIDLPENNVAVWGDFNNDGWYDILLHGYRYCTQQTCDSYLYTNNQGTTFTETLLPEVRGYWYSIVAVADYDRDGDLDVAAAGDGEFRLYRNQYPTPNSLPEPPSVLSQSVDGGQVKLSWNAGSDQETPTAALSYNVYVRDEQGKLVVSPLADSQSGFRRVVGLGNASLNLGYTLRCLPAGTYTWAVQSIDASYRGSAFSTEQQFTIVNAPPAAPENVSTSVTSNQRVQLTWDDKSDYEVAYEMFRTAETSTFTPLDTPLAILPANTTTFTDTFSLASNTTYVYRVVATTCAHPSEFFGQATASTFADPFQIDYGLYLDEAHGTFSSLADLDNDGDLDLLLTYSNDETNTPAATYIYRWEGDHYERTDQEFPVFSNDATLRWIDINRDGYLDFWHNLREHWYEDSLAVYINDGTGRFATPDLPVFVSDSGNIPSNFFWEDYDHDGDVDIMLSGGGYDEALPITILEQTTAGVFNDAGITEIRGSIKSREPWADYDNDGDLDLLVAQTTGCGENRWVIYEQETPKVFVPKALPNVPALTASLSLSRGQMTWLDYDSDGWLDILYSGSTYCGNGEGTTGLLRNNGDRTFSSVFEETFVQEIYDVQLAWGDYDNDGDTDIFVYGDPFGGFSSQTRIYENENNVAFQETSPYLQKSTHRGHMAVGDVEGDGDLDAIVLGEANYVSPKIILYRNNVAPLWNQPNTRPEAPANLKTILSGTTIRFSWDRATDLESPESALTYNIYVKDSTGRFVVNPYTGQDDRLLYPRLGNAQKNDFFLASLPKGTYTWGVQAVDNGHLSSVFSEPATFLTNGDGMVTAVEPDKQLPTMRLYPNPATQTKVFVQLPPETSGAYYLTVTDSYGRQCYIQSSFAADAKTPLEIDWSAKSSGIYYVRLKIQDRVYSQKLVQLAQP